LTVSNLAQSTSKKLQNADNIEQWRINSLVALIKIIANFGPMPNVTVKNMQETHQ